MPSNDADGRTPGRLRWHWERLRTMPPLEIPHRMRELSRRRIYRSSAFAPRRASDSALRTALLADLLTGRGTREAVVDHWRLQYEAAASGELTLLGATWPKSTLPQWWLDPITGHSWPDAYCFDIDYRHFDSSTGDVKYVWELNRLQFLIPISAYAAYAHDEDAADYCAAALTDWVTSNPPGRGIAWGSPIEHALRIFAMRTVYELVEQVRPDDALGVIVGQSIAIQLQWIKKFPSLFSSANNHRLAELAALLLGSVLLPDVLTREDAAETRRELEQEALRQIHPDGIGAEQATGYSLFALEWLALSVHIARVAGAPLIDEVERRVALAAETLQQFRDCQGNLVILGDNDQSGVLRTSLPESESLQFVLDLASVPDARPCPGLQVFAAGGYSVARDDTAAGEVLWVMDHGPLGYGHIAAHAHADTLAVWLHVAGRPLFVDAGTFGYHSAGRWRDVLRSTALHNTLTVEGTDSSTMTGPFNWSKGARAAGRLLCATADGETWTVQAEHDGYQRRFGVIHQRTLTGLGDGHYRLVDRLVGDRAHAVAWNLVLAPDVTVEASRDGWTLRRDGLTVAEVTCPPGWQARDLRGADDPKAGWFSAEFGSLTPTSQLQLAGHLAPGAELCVDIRIHGGDQSG